MEYTEEWTKKEVAAFLSVSEKTIERYVQRRELFPRWGRGKNGKILLFNIENVKTYRDQQEKSEPYAAKDEQALATTIDSAKTRASSLDRQQTTTQDTLINAHQLEAFATVIVNATLNARTTIVAVENKLTLSIADAANLSGLSQKTLRDAVLAGKLKIVPGQRGAKNIRRSDLDKLIENL